jgi:hypothetical protein
VFASSPGRGDGDQGFKVTRAQGIAQPLPDAWIVAFRPSEMLDISSITSRRTAKAASDRFLKRSSACRTRGSGQVIPLLGTGRESASRSCRRARSSSSSVSGWLSRWPPTAGLAPAEPSSADGKGVVAGDCTERASSGDSDSGIGQKRAPPSKARTMTVPTRF